MNPSETVKYGFNRTGLVIRTVFAAFSRKMVRRALEEWAVDAATDDDWNRIAQVSGLRVLIAVTVNIE